MTDLLESEFQAQVVDLSAMFGWGHMHVRKCRGRGGAWTTPTTIAGWPDEFFWHERWATSFYAELKKEDGVVKPEQAECHDRLRAAGLVVYVWRPSDWDDLQAVLSKRPQSR